MYNSMIENIKLELYSDKLKSIIKKFWNKTNSLYVTSIFVGEVFTYFSIHKDYNKFEKYIEKMEKLYDETIDFKKYNYPKLKKAYRNISNIFDEVILDTESFKMERSKILCESIMERLNINKSVDELEDEDDKKIKDFFVSEYINNGFVIHSFHSSLYNSIIEKGLSSQMRLWDDSEIMKLGDIFFKKGAFAALGGYTYYNGQGLYFEHNYRKLYSHAIYSPEWFNFLTSANHLTGFPDIDRAPFALKNYNACKQNVIDLCDNVGLDEENKNLVLNMFNKYYDIFNSKKVMTAIIPKKVVLKNKIDNNLIENINSLETIIYLSSDINEEYKEHFGNVWNGEIPSKDFNVLELPPLEYFIQFNDFVRETKDELFELSAVEHMKRHLARILNSVGDTVKAKELLDNGGTNEKN